jgi:hypothetical protein
VSNGSVPLIFDSRGDFGALAQSSRAAAGPDVPEGLLHDRPDADEGRSVHHMPNASREGWEEGGGDALLSPRDFIATTIPKKVLVDFRDVFGSSGGGLTGSGSSRTIQDGSLDPLDRSRTYRDESIAESFATFGGRRPSQMSGEDGDDDEGWEYTLSAYNSGEDTSSPKMRAGARRDTPDPTPAIQFLDPFASGTVRLAHLIPKTSSTFSDSPASLAGTELITPNHTVDDLPRTSVATTSSSFSTGIPAWATDTPTPKPPATFRNPMGNVEGLGLQLGYMNDQASKVAVRAAESKWEEGLARLPKKGTPYAKGRRRSPTVDEELPELPPLPPNAIIPAPPLPSYRSLPKPESDVVLKTFPSMPIIEVPPLEDDSFPALVEKALRSIPKTTTITLQVDQESNREVRTSLKYRKIHKPQVFRDRESKALEEAALWCESPTRVEMFQQTGCIEFGMDPKAREKWSFRHAVSSTTGDMFPG